MINGKTYAIGNRTLVKDDASILSELETLSEAGKTALVVCEDNVPVGIVACADPRLYGGGAPCDDAYGR